MSGAGFILGGQDGITLAHFLLLLFAQAGSVDGPTLVLLEVEKQSAVVKVSEELLLEDRYGPFARLDFDASAFALWEAAKALERIDACVGQHDGRGQLTWANCVLYRVGRCLLVCLVAL